MKLEITIPVPDEFAHISQERWEELFVDSFCGIIERLETEAAAEARLARSRELVASGQMRIEPWPVPS